MTIKKTSALVQLEVTFTAHVVALKTPVLPSTHCMFAHLHDFFKL